MNTSAKNSSELHTVELPTLQQLLIQIGALQVRVEKLESVTVPAVKEQKEMTDTDALAILTGEHAKLSHNEAAQKLGLSYGQIYSCRLEYTFRHIHKQLKSQTPPFINGWKKK